MSRLTWSSTCDYADCGKVASIIEKGNPRCRSHTASGLKLIAAKEAKQESIAKAEVRRLKAVAEYEKGFKKATANARMGVKSNVFVGISGRKRAFYLCSRCSSNTESGLAEKDPALRFCSLHMPSNIALRRAELGAGYRQAARCVSNGIRARQCKTRRVPVGLDCRALPRKCHLITHECFNAYRKWAIVRIRCCTWFDKRTGSAPALRPEEHAPRP